MSHETRQRLPMWVLRAETPPDVLACKRLVGQVYAKRYGVTLADGAHDPLRKREAWPDRFALARVGEEVVAVAGLYEGRTYAEAFGGVSRSDIEGTARAAGVSAEGRPVVEFTRLVVAPGWEGMGLGATFVALTHSRGFLCPHGGPTPIVLVCATLSVFGSVWRRARVHTRTIAPFPEYPSHERYRAADNPMETRMVIPELDLDPITHALQLPIALDLTLDGARRVA